MYSLVLLARALPLETSDAAADIACAAAVAAFQGDINKCVPFAFHLIEPLLHFIARRNAPRTLAALAARADINPTQLDEYGEAAICDAVRGGAEELLEPLLAAFLTLDLNAPCQRDGTKPLAFAMRVFDGRLCASSQAVLRALLDAGAEFTDPETLDCYWKKNPFLATVAAPYSTWARRRAWVAACVEQADLSSASTLLAAVLGDALLRLCIVEPESFRLVSEYAGLVATFL